MTKEEYINLKNDLKKLALEIKLNKKENKILNKNLTVLNNELAKIRVEKEAKIKEYNEVYNKTIHSISKIIQLKHEYRIKHIFYSLIRGKKYIQIERKCKNVIRVLDNKGNVLDWYLGNLFDKYQIPRPTVKDMA